MTAVQHALKGVSELHREGVGYALVLDELDKALLADPALQHAVTLLNSSANAAGNAANEFRAASRILTDRDDTEGYRIALDASQDATTAHEMRREIEAILTRIDEINRLIHAVKERVTTTAGHVQSLQEQGRAYVHRIAQ